MIIGALSSEIVSVFGSSGEIVGEGLALMLISATREPVKIFVPVPSFAKTEPEEKLKFAVPAVFVLKVIVRILPLAPVYPGFNTMPSKLTVPALFENDGSCTQREKIDPVFERETTSSLSHGKEITPEAAFMAWSELPAYTLMEKVLPTLYDSAGWEKERVAALTESGASPIRKKNKTIL